MGFHELFPSSVFTYLYRQLTEIAISKSKLLPNTLSYDILRRCWSRTVYVCLWKMYSGFSLHIICCLGAVSLSVLNKNPLFWVIAFITHCFSSPRTLTKVKTSPWPNLLFSNLHTDFIFFTLWKFARCFKFFFFSFFTFCESIKNCLKLFSSIWFLMFY